MVVKKAKRLYANFDNGVATGSETSLLDIVSHMLNFKISKLKKAMIRKTMDVKRNH